MPAYHAPKFRGVPPGLYELEVIDATESLTKNGDEMLTLKLCAGPSTSPIIERLVFIDNCAGPIGRCLSALGVEVAAGAEITPADVIGRKAEADVIIEEFNGRQQNKVKRWHPRADSKAGGGQ